MPRRSRKALPLPLALLALLAATGCDRAPAASAPQNVAAPTETLGLMTSLPLYWPLGVAVGDIAKGGAAVPWQRAAIEAHYRIEPLDTLAPIPALSPDAPATDPLAPLDRLAVIQPRGLSPADNVALDDWVRAGGRLLLVLDPMLMGDYDLPFGDPRRPVDSAVIPPVVARWGLAVSYDEGQSAKPVDSDLDGQYLPLILSGEVAIVDPGAAECRLTAGNAAARCRVGKGEVTLIADATPFESPSFAGKDAIVLRQLLQAVLR